MTSRVQKIVILTLAVVIVTVGVAAVALGTGSGNDGSLPVTKYLAARRAFVNTAMTDLRRSGAAMNMYVARVRQTCGDSLKDAPWTRRFTTQRDRRRTMQAEATFFLMGARAFEIIQEEQRAAAVRRFAARINDIHWPNEKVTRLMRVFAQYELRRLQRVPANLCAEFYRWAATGFRTPLGLATGEREPTSTALSRALGAVGCGTPLTVAPAMDILAVLRRYDRRDRDMRQLEVMEYHLNLQSGQVAAPAELALEHVLRPRSSIVGAPKPDNSGGYGVSRAKSKVALPSVHPCVGFPGSAPRSAPVGRRPPVN